MARRLVSVGLGLVLFGAAAAHAAPDTSHLDSERDALLDKITRGVDYEASVRRWKELIAERDKIVATSAAAIARQREEEERERAARAELYRVRKEYQETADYEVGWRCTLSPDPAHPIPSREGRYLPDWGKVVRKEKTRLPPRNALDEGEAVTMYELRGVAGSYQFGGEKFGPHNRDFEAEVGDLVLLCGRRPTRATRVAPGWGPEIVQSGFAVRLAEPPLIVKKARWAPIHVTGSVFSSAIREVKWRFPPEAFLLSNIEIARDLGGGRYEIASSSASWILEVPPRVKVKEPLVAGRAVWAIMGQPRFDAGLKKLVLVAEDLEPRYIKEK